MRYTIYRTTNLINGKTYIGKHQTVNPNDSYLGSGKALKNSIKLHGKSNFIKAVLFDFDTEHEMNLKEAELVTEEFISRSDNYNAGVGGQGGAHFKGRTHTPQAKQKIKSHFSDPIVRKRQSVNQLGKVISDETRLKLSLAMKGKNKNRILTDEHKLKISSSLLGQRHSIDRRESFAIARTGLKYSKG